MSNFDRPAKAAFIDLYQATPDSRGFFESILGFGKLAGQWVRVRASDQRRHFGNVPFGKLAIKVGEDGRITTFKTQAYGKDWDYGVYYFDHGSKKWLNGEDRHEISALPCRQ
jgi:hypothetical protein